MCASRISGKPIRIVLFTNGTQFMVTKGTLGSASKRWTISLNISNSSVLSIWCSSRNHDITSVLQTRSAKAFGSDILSRFSPFPFVSPYIESAVFASSHMGLGTERMCSCFSHGDYGDFITLWKPFIYGLLVAVLYFGVHSWQHIGSPCEIKVILDFLTTIIQYPEGHIYSYNEVASIYTKTLKRTIFSHLYIYYDILWGPCEALFLFIDLSRG